MTYGDSDYSTKVGPYSQSTPVKADTVRHVGDGFCIDKFLTCVLWEKHNLVELWDIVRPFRVCVRDE